MSGVVRLVSDTRNRLETSLLKAADQARASDDLSEAQQALLKLRTKDKILTLRAGEVRPLSI